MRKTVLLLSLILIAFLRPGHAEAQLVDTKAISLDGAKAILAAAEAEAERNSWPMAIAVVDAGGQLIALHRRDGTQTASIQIAIDKARSAAAFRRPTEALQQMVAGGTVGVMNVEGAMPLGGGIPVLLEGVAIGAIGVSGGSVAQDAQVAQAGLEALRM